MYSAFRFRKDNRTGAKVLPAVLVSTFIVTACVIGLLGAVTGCSTDSDSGSPLDSAMVTRGEGIIITSNFHGKTFKAGDSLHIQWSAANPEDKVQMIVEISPNGGREWLKFSELYFESIGPGDAEWGDIKLALPETSTAPGSSDIVSMISDSCKVQVIGYDVDFIWSQSGGYFSIKAK